MDIDMVLASASCDLKICSGHARNNDIVGMRQCWEAAVNRIDAVIAFCELHDIEQHYKLDNLVKYATDLHDDLTDSEEMLAAYKIIPEVQ